MRHYYGTGSKQSRLLSQTVGYHVVSAYHLLRINTSQHATSDIIARSRGSTVSGSSVREKNGSDAWMNVQR